MNKKAEATLLELLLEIIQTATVFSNTKAELLQKLINELQSEV
jgi:hypothetical protein